MRKLNRATAVAVSLAMVGVLGFGTGLAVASAESPQDQVVETSPFGGQSGSQPGGRGQTNPQAPGGTDSGQGLDDFDGGFQVGPPSGGSHGSSGMS